MQLVNMDVERYGSPVRTRLGPFSPGLNAICGPKGSGKTSLLNWLRHMASEGSTQFGSTLQSPVSGIVEVVNDGQRWQWHSPRQGRSERSSGHTVGNLTATQREALAALATASGAADTEAALQHVAARFGLDGLVSSPDTHREQLLKRQREIESRLQTLPRTEAHRESLLARRNELERELQMAQSAAQPADRTSRSDSYSSAYHRFDNRREMIEADLRDTLARIEQLDRELAEVRGELKVIETDKATVTVDQSYRLQLQEIDDRLTRWRQTLRDLKAHRNRIEHDATDAQLDKQVGEQLSITKEPDPHAPLRSLEAQILSARKQLDALVDRYSLFGEPRPEGYAVHTDTQGRTRIDYSNDPRTVDSSSLPETLRSMQRDLYEACQQLARHEARAATQTLQQQSEQLQRCETELLHSVEKLIEERATLLRKIADAYHLSSEQLSLAFGNWCDCHDHNHLQDWLLNDCEVKTSQVGHDPLARRRLLERLEAIAAERQTAEVRADHCKRQMRDTELQRHGLVNRGWEPAHEPGGRLVADIQSDLELLHTELRRDDDHQRLVAELEELRQRLNFVRPQVRSSSPFRDAVHRHVAGLMGNPSYGSAQSHQQRPADATHARYDLVDGIVYEPATGSPSTRREMQVPAALVRVAHRLAIAEGLAARSEPIVVLLDEALDHVAYELQPAAVSHLAQVTATGQQVFLLTGDQRIADLVHEQHGLVAYLHRPSEQAVDINRQLAALANDYELEKWYQPVALHGDFQRSPPASRREFYLTERSPVEDSPSIDALAASRCRAVGVDRVGDLLDVDPYWLADQLRLEDVSEATVGSWQAEARLLCSVRQLRPFDARLLVSIGVRTPQQLAAMHPSQLLDRVEHFVATPSGRRLLRSGSSYELSRITTWIASAKGGTSRYGRSSFVDDYDADHDYAASAERDNSYGYAADQDFEDQDFEDQRRSSGSRENRANRGARNGRRSSQQRETRGDAREAEAGEGRQRNRHTDRDYPVLNGSSSNRRRQRSESTSDETNHRSERQRSDSLKLAQAEFERVDNSRLKFYLELASSVHEAPSIGPRMAGRLEKFGIHCVDQLLTANAESLADRLNLRRVDADLIRAWQEQARLVCRIPNLRGHDAQLLVACNLTAPEELATMNAASVLAQVNVIAESSEGQRILRGGKQPDLAEVTDWIHWASQCRSLNAA